MMIETFHNSPCLLISRPLVCHRTPSQREKREELGSKTSENDFMSDAGSRNAKYLSLRFIKSLNELVRRDALSYQDIANVREGLFGKKMLVDFLIESTELALEKQINFTLQEWIEADIFSDTISLSPHQRSQTKLLNE